MTEVIALIPAYIRTLTQLTSAQCEAILVYLDTYGVSNIHVLGKTQLDGWLIPTLRSVPRFVKSNERTEIGVEGS